MHRIDDATATVDNQFTEGDPTAGTLATVVKADWLNSLQEEIAGVIEGAGITLSKPDQGQLLEAITTLIDAATPSASTTAEGVIELATNAEAQAQTDAARAITPATLAQALKGSNQSLASPGYQKLPGGLIIQWGASVVSLDGSGDGELDVTFPIPFSTLFAVGQTIVASTPGSFSRVSFVTTTTLTLAVDNGTPGSTRRVDWHAFGIGA